MVVFLSSQSPSFSNNQKITPWDNHHVVYIMSIDPLGARAALHQGLGPVQMGPICHQSGPKTLHIGLKKIIKVFVCLLDISPYVKSLGLLKLMFLLN